MLQLELPHINVLSKVDLITQYGELGTFNRILFDMADKVTLKFLTPQDFNLDFYTEVQDLSHLENLLTSASPR